MLAIRNKTNPSIRHFFNVFDDIFESSFLSNNIPCDIIENDKEYLIEFSLAGIKKEDISIIVEKDQLVINAERKEKDVKYNRQQISFGKYEKIFILPDNIDTDNISSSFTDGILAIIIPKIIDEKILKKKKIEIM
jgi:HSP20 family protein